MADKNSLRSQLGVCWGAGNPENAVETLKKNKTIKTVFKIEAAIL